MKNLLQLLILLFFIQHHLFGQNQGVALTGQPLTNMYLYNPAYAGAENFTNLQAGYRKYWTGIQNSPNSFFLSGHSAYVQQQPVELEKEEFSLSNEELAGNALPVRSRSATKYIRNRKAVVDSASRAQAKNEREFNNKVKMQKYKFARRPFHGFGFVINNEQTGFTARTGFYASYARHIYVDKNTRLSLGVSGGLFQTRIDANYSDIYFRDANDPAITGISNIIRPDLNVGLLLYNKNYFAGLSAYSLLPTSSELVKYPGDPSPNLPPVILGQTGYKFEINDASSFIPFITARYSTGFPLYADLGARVNYNMFWIGAVYRSVGAASAMAGFAINKMFDLSYSYDYTFSAVNGRSANGHEIILGYRLPRKGGNNNSRFFDNEPKPVKKRK